MLKRELKVNLKSFIIWNVILLGVFLIVYLMYPSIVASDNVSMMDEMLQMFPEEMLKAFNYDISMMDTAYGWLKSEGFVFVLLITGCYAGIIGSSILLKEENDKTIEYLNTLPIKRKDIVINKAIVGVIYIVIMIALLTIFNYISLTLSGTFDKKQFFLLSITPLFPALVLYFICMFISTFSHKTKKMFGISLGIVLISYFLQMLSQISESVEFLKYASIFTLADIRNVIVDVSINPVMVIISIVLIVIFFGLTIINYNKKELV